MFMTARLTEAAATISATSAATSTVANSTRRADSTTNAISARVTPAVKMMLGKLAFVEPEVAHQDGGDQRGDGPGRRRTKARRPSNKRAARARSRTARASLSEDQPFDPSWIGRLDRHKSFTEQHSAR